MTETATTPPGATPTDVPTFKHFIAGEWTDSTSGATFESHNPADERDIIGRFQQGTAADVAMAVKAARGRPADVAAHPGTEARRDHVSRSPTSWPSTRNAWPGR